MAKEKKIIPVILTENTPEGKTILFEYVRTNPKRKTEDGKIQKVSPKRKTEDGKIQKVSRKIGLLVSTGKGTVGWSLCKKSARVLIDEFKTVLEESDIETERELYGISKDTDVIETVVQKFRITKGDKFDFEIALKKALKNEERGGPNAFEVPNSIKEHVAQMIERSNKYFK